MKKIIYFTSPSFFDFEISLIRELSKIADVRVILLLTPSSMKNSGFSIDSLDIKCEIIPAINYIQLNKYTSLIDINNWVVANLPDNTILNNLYLARLVLSYIKKINPDLIHFTSFYKNILYILPFIPRKIKRLITVHDPIPHINERGILKKMKRHSIFLFIKNILLMNSLQDKQFMNEYKSFNFTLYHSTLGIYDYLCNYDLNDLIEGDYILFTGRISKYKGIDVLLAAFDKSYAKINGIKLVIAGRGDFDFDVSKYIEDDQVIFINRYIENDELASLISNSLFVTCPYIEATQSGVIMSSYALKKPVIASKIGGLPSMVIDFRTGLLVKPNNVDDLVEAIDLLVKDRSLIKSMSKTIDKMYFEEGEKSWKNIAQDLLAAYNLITQNF